MDGKASWLSGVTLNNLIIKTARSTVIYQALLFIIFLVRGLKWSALNFLFANV